MPENIGKLLVGVGIAFIAIGLIVWLLGDRLSGFGNLPGDLRIERPGFSLYIPITTMIALSIGLSAVMWLISWISRFFNPQ